MISNRSKNRSKLNHFEGREFALEMTASFMFLDGKRRRMTDVRLEDVQILYFVKAILTSDPL